MSHILPTYNDGQARHYSAPARINYGSVIGGVVFLAGIAALWLSTGASF